MTMKNLILDTEEKEILGLYERGELKRSKTKSQDLTALRRAARATLQKNKRINIRLSERDLIGIQTRAVEEGMPYQTLISSVLHRYLSGLLIDKRSA
jgi:predicted DNA binding CopG/RHH family protein